MACELAMVLPDVKAQTVWGAFALRTDTSDLVLSLAWAEESVRQQVAADGAGHIAVVVRTDSAYGGLRLFRRARRLTGGDDRARRSR